MSEAPNPYGDGKASERIVQAIKVYFNLEDSVSEFHEGGNWVWKEIKKSGIGFYVWFSLKHYYFSTVIKSILIYSCLKLSFWF